MSIRAAILRFYLRHEFKRRFGPESTVEDLRSSVDTFARRLRPLPSWVRRSSALEAGKEAEWIAVPGSEESGRILLYFHGGGYVSGRPAIYRELAWRLAQAAQARVLLVDYRLAPEHPFPAAVEDAVAAYRWVLSQGFPARSVGCVGDSAGGGLCFSALLRLRDEGGPLPGAACGFSAWTDLALKGKTVESNRQADPMLAAEWMPTLASWYLGPVAPTNPAASPLYADLRGLPPTLLQAGSTEILLDDSRRLAEKLRAAGTEAVVDVWPGMPHFWHIFAPLLPEASAAIEQAGLFFREKLRLEGSERGAEASAVGRSRSA